MFVWCVLISVYTTAQSNIPVIQSEVQFVDYKSIPQYNRKKKKSSTLFQGNKQTHNYFEGWYYKMVASRGETILSVIPGIALSADGNDQHAFIQIINGITGKTSYHSYPIEDFSFGTERHQVKIQNNYFSTDKIVLNISDGDVQLFGEINMLNTTKYSDRKFGRRDIMGWYRKLPFLECYHGVVSLTHELEGKIELNGQVSDFTSGKGYIEKDWGSSMPSSWIWLQSNNFEASESSFMISIANVPLENKSFNGFLGFLYYDDKVYRFGTYTRSKMRLDIVDKNTIKINIQSRKEVIEIEAIRNQYGLLQAPDEGTMDRRIAESIDADIKIKLFDKKGNLMYSDQSKIAGFELVGDVEKLKN